MKNLVHIKQASEQLGLTESELNDLVDSKQIPHVVQSMTKMIKQSTIDEILGKDKDVLHYNQNLTIDEDYTIVDKENPAHFILPIMATLGEGNKIDNLEWVNPDKTK